MGLVTHGALGRRADQPGDSHREGDDLEAGQQTRHGLGNQTAAAASPAKIDPGIQKADASDQVLGKLCASCAEGSRQCGAHGARMRSTPLMSGRTTRRCAAVTTQRTGKDSQKLKKPGHLNRGHGRRGTAVQHIARTPCGPVRDPRHLPLLPCACAASCRSCSRSAPSVLPLG